MSGAYDHDDAARTAVAPLFVDMRFKLSTVFSIEETVRAALLMIERGALTPKQARKVLTPREALVFDKAMES